MKRKLRREILRRLPEKIYRSEDLRELVQRVDDQGREFIAQMFLFHDATIQRALAGHPDRLGIAAGAHDAIDQSVQKMLACHPRAGEVRCGKGCDGCCHIPVAVSRCEAQLLVAFAADQGVVVDRDRLRRQATAGAEGYAGLSREDRACVFLKDRACSVYEHRPGACRKMHVITDPALCDPVEHPRQIVGRLATPEAEVIWSALLTRDKRGDLPAMLLQELS